MSAIDLEMVTHGMGRLQKALAEAPHWQIIETYWNTAMQQNIIWSIAFEAHTMEILKEYAESTAHGEYYRVKPVPGSRTSE